MSETLPTALADEPGISTQLAKTAFTAFCLVAPRLHRWDKLGQYLLPTPEEIEELRKKQERERAERYLWVYGLLGLRVVAHKDRSLVVSGTFGGRKLPPGEPRMEDPLLYYEDPTVLSSSSDSQRYRHASACFRKHKT